MATPERVYKVGISGSYGGMNLGDEAILECIIKQLRAFLLVEITVFSQDPADTIKRHKVEKAVPVRRMSREEVIPEIEPLDLFILGGGGILFDGAVRDYLREVAVAHDRGVPVMIYAVGAGPLKDSGNQELVRRNLEKAAVVTVREKGAKKTLEDAGVERDIIVTADPALLLEPEPLSEGCLQREGLEGRERMFGMSVRECGPAAPDLSEEIYHALLANAADYMVDRYDAYVVFVPMERKVLDMQQSHAVVSKMLRPQRADILREDYSAGQILSLMERFVFAVGMRLHFLIFAALQKVPFVALPYASKVLGFLDDLDIEMPPLKLVNSGRLMAYIDKAYDNDEQIREHIGRLLPDLRERARETNRIAVNLLKGLG